MRKRKKTMNRQRTRPGRYDRTLSGVALTEELVEALAEEAETGYDIEKLEHRRTRTPEEIRIPRQPRYDKERHRH